MGNKLFGAIIGVLVIGVVGILIFAGGDDTPADLTREDVLAIDETDHFKGVDPAEAEVQIIEYFDFLCGACAQIKPVTDQLIAEYEGQPVSFVTRNFSFLGGPSPVAHRAAEAAGLQGKYYEMYDLLFQQQQIWANTSDPSEMFADYADQLELDVDQFTLDLNSAEVGSFLASDKTGAAVLGVNATPTFFINGLKLENTPQGIEAFRGLIDAELSSATEAAEAPDSNEDASAN